MNFFEDPQEDEDAMPETKPSNIKPKKIPKSPRELYERFNQGKYASWLEVLPAVRTSWTNLFNELYEVEKKLPDLGTYVEIRVGGTIFRRGIVAGAGTEPSIPRNTVVFVEQPVHISGDYRSWVTAEEINSISRFNLNTQRWEVFWGESTRRS